MAQIPASLPSIALPADLLRDALRAVEPASSTDSTRPHLCGVRLAVYADGALEVAATDGHRLHVAHVAVRGGLAAGVATLTEITLTPAGAWAATKVAADAAKGAADAAKAAEAAHRKATKAHKGTSATAPVLRLPMPVVALASDGTLTVGGRLRGVAEVARDADLPAREILAKVAKLANCTPEPLVGVSPAYMVDALEAARLITGPIGGVHLSVRGEYDAIRVSSGVRERTYTDGEASVELVATVMPMRL